MASRRIIIAIMTEAGIQENQPVNLIADTERGVMAWAENIARDSAYVRVMDANIDNHHLRDDEVILRYNPDRDTVNAYYGKRGMDRVMKMIDVAV